MLTWSFVIIYIIMNIVGNQGESKVSLTSKFERKLSSLRNYQIAAVTELHNSMLKTRWKSFQIDVFGQKYYLDFESQTHHNGVSVDLVKSINQSERQILYNIDCFFSGQPYSADFISVNINFCNGLEGMMVTENLTFFIEPAIENGKPFNHSSSQQHIVYEMEDMKYINDLTDYTHKLVVNDPFKREPIVRRRRNRRNIGYESFLTFHNKIRRRIQLYYLDSYEREKPFISILYKEKRGVNTFVGTIWIARDDKTNKRVLLNGKDRHVAARNSPSRRTIVTVTSKEEIVVTKPSIRNKLQGNTNYIEAMVVADNSVVSFHGRRKVEKYLLTMMNIVAHIFADASTGVKIDLKIKRIVLLDENNNDDGFSVYSRNPTRTLVSACTYAKSLANEDPNHPDHFDYAILLTRKSFGPSGYAQLYSMCSKRRSCAIARDEGLTSAFVIAHETGHLLGLDHDGEGEASSCQSEGPRGSIMAPIIQARYDRFHWSKCSQDVLKENVEYFYCLQNKPSMKQSGEIYSENKSPGAIYSLDEQCQFNFDKTFSRCKSFSYNPCQILWCSEPSRALYCKTMRGPALEGSSCAQDKHCVKGECIFVGNRIGNNGGSNNNGDNGGIKTTRKPKIINGNWGSWSSWSTCSQTCDIGIRKRSRSCDNPRPNAKGKPCSGEASERDVCNTKPCAMIKSFEKRRNEECIKFYGRDWTIYTDDAFQRKLQQPNYQLNCTFQEGFCTWKNDAKNSQMEWELVNGRTPSVNTGPEFDHTTGKKNGKYLYMEASSTSRHSKKEGDVARLISMQLNVPWLCFRMYYHMYGKQIGSLSVKLVYKDRSQSTVWNAKGNLGSAWRFMETTIETDKSYQIVIEAVRGQHWAGDIAIDDVTVYAGKCPTYDKEENPCGIACRSRDARQVKLNVNVTNGMRCSPSPRDSNVCYKGQCSRFGCDNKFDSKKKLDNCGVCGGNGSGCKRKSGRKQVKPKTDYEVMLTLEKGSTFINLKSLTRGRYYLGLRKSTGTGMYLNTNREDYHVIGGMPFLFRNKGDGFHEISSNGPVPENIDVILYSYDRKPVTIDFEYFALKKKEPIYQYLVVGWQSCSQSCGIGKQKAKVECRRISDKRAVDYRYCRNLEKPVFTKVCRLSDCPRRVRWKAERWSQCTRTCNGGRRIRIIRCIDEDTFQIVSNTLCDPSKMPAITGSCNTQRCPAVYKWTTSDWSPCTTTCGEGIRTREVICKDITTNITSEDNKCTTKKPPVRELCNIQDCETYIYEVRMEGACSKTCGGGIKARIVYCVNKKSKSIVLNKYCDGPSPPRIVQCQTEPCPEFVMKVVEETSCSVTCGVGSKIQRRICLNKETGREVDGKNCNNYTLKAVVKCTMEKCPIKRLSFSSWSLCTKLCGGGTQTRTAKCVDEQRKEYPIQQCNRVTKDLLTRTCNKNQCSQPSEVKCDFEQQSICKWKNLKSDQFDWSIDKKTPSFSTGPLADHTTGKGFFAYIETSRPRQRDDVALLVSPAVSIPTGCFQFWYHMRGSSMGTLKLTVNNKTVFEESGQHGANWKQAEIDIKPPVSINSGYRFTFHGIVGYNVYSDIAIDDITFVERSCKDLSSKDKESSCREISPYCKHEKRALLCKQSAPYRGLCCETCKAFV